MTILEAVKISKEVLKDYEGGLRAFYRIVDILDDWAEEHEEEDIWNS